jgi:hypothetical protein
VLEDDARGREGAAVVRTGRFTEVAKKRDGRWVYVVDHASADAAPAAAAK